MKNQETQYPAGTTNPVNRFKNTCDAVERGMTPPRDYVDVSPSKKTSRIDTLMSVLAAPVISAAVFSMSTSVVEWHVAAVYGFSISYVIQAVLVFTWDAIKSIIKGESRGI